MQHACTAHRVPPPWPRVRHHVRRLSASHAHAAGSGQLPPPAVASVVGQGECRHHRPTAAAAPADRRHQCEMSGLRCRGRGLRPTSAASGPCTRVRLVEVGVGAAAAVKKLKKRGSAQGTPFEDTAPLEDDDDRSGRFCDKKIFYSQSIDLDEAVSAHLLPWKIARGIDFSYSKMIIVSLGRVHRIVIATKTTKINPR